MIYETLISSETGIFAFYLSYIYLTDILTV